MEEARREEAEAQAEREENARRRQAETLRVLRGRAENARGMLSTMPLRAEDLARKDPKRTELGQAIIDYALALRDDGQEEWTSWARRVEREPDPIGAQARALLSEVR